MDPSCLSHASPTAVQRQSQPSPSRVAGIHHGCSIYSSWIRHRSITDPPYILHGPGIDPSRILHMFFMDLSYIRHGSFIYPPRVTHASTMDASYIRQEYFTQEKSRIPHKTEVKQQSEVVVCMD